MFRRFCELILTLLCFSACGEDSSLGDKPMVLSGQITNWPAGESGGPILQALVHPALGRPATKPPVIATGTVDAQGNFSITLPVAPEVTPYLGSYSGPEVSPGTCMNGVQTSPNPIRLGNLELQLRVGGKTRGLGQVNDVYADQRTVLVYYIYSAEAGSVTGSLICNSTKVYDEHYQPGWNILIDDLPFATTSSQERWYTGPVPAQVRWSLL